MKKIVFPKLSTDNLQILEACLIVAALVIPFGLQIGQLGLYGDDWANVLFPSISNSYTWLDGLARTALINIAGSHSISYHLITMLLFLIIVLLLHKILLHIGLDSVSALTCAILFQVFPGFLQPTSGLALFPILLGMVFAFSSYYLYFKWIESSAHLNWNLIGGLICSIFSSLFSPFSAVLTSFTFLILVPGWQQNKTRVRIRLAILSSVLLIGSLSSIFLFSTGKTIVGTGILTQSVRVWLDVFMISWRQILAFPLEEGKTLLYLLVLVFSSVAIYWLLKLIERDSEKFEGNLITYDAKNDIVILLFSAGAGLIFVLLMKIFGVPFTVQYPNDLGLVVLGIMAVIFFTIGIKLILVSKYRLVVLAIIITLASGTRYTLINRYVVENSSVEDLISQIAVRADTIKTGTIFVSEQLPLDFTTQESIDALLRKKFNNDSQISSTVFINADNPEFRDFLRNTSQNEIDLRIGIEKVHIKKSALIGFWIQQGGCLQLLDNKSELPDLPQELKYVALLSDPKLLSSSNLSDVKQLNEFRNKIENGWCFYYQLASKQAAEEKWNDVLLTYSDAASQEMNPQSFVDNLPLLKASLRQNPLHFSLKLSKEIISSPEQKDVVCEIWQDYQTESDLNKEVIPAIQEAYKSLECPK